jgi:hypothetical protein
VELPSRQVEASKLSTPASVLLPARRRWFLWVAQSILNYQRAFRHGQTAFGL